MNHGSVFDNFRESYMGRSRFRATGGSYMKVTPGGILVYSKSVTYGKSHENEICDIVRDYASRNISNVEVSFE